MFSSIFYIFPNYYSIYILCTFQQQLEWHEPRNSHEKVGRAITPLTKGTKGYRRETPIKLIPFVIPKQQKMDQVVTNDSEKQAYSRPIIISVEGIPKDE
ncbi:MAG: hypothetical protein IPL56_16525 [Saprospiraceae bacterium]|nr:hypothetical protein [Saprospiraceae bacterium]